MAQPFNYMLNLPDPTNNVMSGVQNALGIAKMASERNVAEQKALDLQRAREQQVTLESDLAKLSQNPTPSALASMMVKYPSLSEQFKRTYDVLNTEQQQARVGQASQVYAALQADKPDVAIQILGEQANAYRNSGMDKDAKTLDDLSELIRMNPATAKTSTGLFLASAMGPDKFTETFTKLETDRRAQEKQPFEVTEAQAKAQKAAVDAKFAESNAALDLQKKGWDITKIQEDIKIAKQNASIAALNAQIAREGNQLKREELSMKLQEMKDKRDTSVREKAADLESARANVDNMLNTADRVLKTPMGVVGSAAGPVSARMPTLSQDTADFEELVNTLGSQAFLAQIPNIKGTGALSDAEGKKLQSALQNLSREQSEKQFRENLDEAARLLIKGREGLARATGVPLGKPDTPAAPGARPPLSAFNK